MPEMAAGEFGQPWWVFSIDLRSKKRYELKEQIWVKLGKTWQHSATVLGWLRVLSSGELLLDDFEGRK